MIGMLMGVLKLITGDDRDRVYVKAPGDVEAAPIGAPYDGYGDGYGDGAVPEVPAPEWQWPTFPEHVEFPPSYERWDYPELGYEELQQIIYETPKIGISPYRPDYQEYFAEAYAEPLRVTREIRRRGRARAGIVRPEYEPPPMPRETGGRRPGRVTR